MAGKSAAIAALLVALAAAPAWADGQLAIQSKPAGAAVTLDGSYAGTTPVLLDAPAGHYRIRVSMPGRAPQSFVATVRDGLTTRRSVSLGMPRPASGELVVRSYPTGATVVVDGRALGATPLRLPSLSPGRHRVRLTREGWLATARTVSVHPGLTATLGLELQRAPAPAPVARAVPAPAPRPTTAPIARHVEPGPRPVEAAPRHVTPPMPPPGGVSTTSQGADRAPVAPAVPSPVVVAPPASPATATPSDFRPWVFWALMAALLAWVARQLWWVRRTVAAPAPWHPARGPLGVMAWPAEGAPSPESHAAVAAMARGHWRVGLDALWLAIEQEPGQAWHYYHIGLALNRLERPMEAEGAYRTAAQLDPGWIAPAYNLGVLLAETGQPAQAVIAYRRMLEAHPTHVAGLYNLGHAFVALGMPAQAIAHWKTARRHVRRDVALRENLDQLQREVRKRPKAGRPVRLAS